MEYKFEVGQKVIIYGNNGYMTLAEVEKVTPSGLVKVNGSLYYKDGRERSKSTWNHFWIKPASEEDVMKIERKEYIQRVFNKLRDIKGMDYATAFKINEVLEEAEKTGGITKKSDENKAWEH